MSQPPPRNTSRTASRAPSRAPPPQNGPYQSSPPHADSQTGPLLPGPYPHPPAQTVPPSAPSPVTTQPLHPNYHQQQYPQQQQQQQQYQEQQSRGPRKRLIATCDGTWLDADNGMTSDDQQPSNVSRIGWAMKDTSSDGVPQIVHYTAGIGSSGGRTSRYVAGLTALGLGEYVRESYSFVAVNWAPADEIFLLGFSRGAWTARSVGGMIGDVGLLTRAGMPYFSAIYEDYEHRNDENYVSKQPDIPFPNKPSFSDPSYVDELVRRGLTRVGIPIKAIGVWETVGSLGIPRLGFLESLRLQSRSVHEYAFYDTELGENVEHAFQALALDEHRAPFVPAVWEKPKNSRTNLTQVWFPGVHSNVGGGYPDTDISDITLAWMISRLEPFIDFRQDYIIQQGNLNRQYYKQTRQRPRPWSFGLIPDSQKGLYNLSGSKTRTPGNYFRVDPYTGRQTERRLRQTNEYIHASVRSRTTLRGPGVTDRGIYVSKALRDWDCNVVQQPIRGPNGVQNEPLVVWRKRSVDPDHTWGSQDAGQTEIPEAALVQTEVRLLGLTPKVEGYVLGKETRPPPRMKSGRGDRDRRASTGGGGTRDNRNGRRDTQKNRDRERRKSRH